MTYTCNNFLSKVFDQHTFLSIIQAFISYTLNQYIQSFQSSKYILYACKTDEGKIKNVALLFTYKIAINIWSSLFACYQSKETDRRRKKNVDIKPFIQLLVA